MIGNIFKASRRATIKAHNQFLKNTPLPTRYFSLQPPSDIGDYEKDIYKKLVDSLEPEELMVKDISGGCGSMFAISIVSKRFNGLTMMKQHRLVNEILADDIKQWHGLQLRTKEV